jgi:sugar lactone lactonase YvrE
MKVIALVVLTLLTLTDRTAMAARIELVAGGGQHTNHGPAREIELREPFGIAFNSRGIAYIVEMGQGNRLWQLDPKGRAEVVGGTGEKGYGGDNGPALKAAFNGVHNLAITPSDDIYLADTWNNRIRRLTGNDLITSTVAGTGERGYSGDGGPAVAAKLGGIYCATLDFKGERLYMADLHNRRVRYLDIKTGVVHAFAGNGQKGRPQDGSVALTAPLTDPRAVAADRQGNVYILERGGHALCVVRPDGRLYTVVNAAGRKGATGDGGPAIEATMSGPKHICIDPHDNVIIADAENHLIRRYQPKDGRIVRLAGTGKRGAKGVGGDPLTCELARPHGVTIGPDGHLYIVDSYNNRVLRIVE